ncbi:hypothetical protein [uncultured Treponema sp.]|uniref:hypothetical protein n=1 Tax=uncultured Treponema sp. TaxID=162155 RepID=UPI0025F855CA|nr:hypothetical protein [uncultured Treponema sp.]
MNEEKALSYVQNLVFEITRYNAKSLTSMPEAIPLAQISKTASNILTKRKIVDSVRNPVYLCEFYFPEKIGIIDATFCPEDLYVTNDFFAGIENIEGGEEEEESDGEIIEEFDWIDQILQTLNSQGVKTENPDAIGILDGSKILEMLEDNDSRGIDSQGSEKTEDEVPEEHFYTKKDGALRRFSYDGEQFTVWKDGENTVLVNFYGEKLIRKHFDVLYRLVKTEQFKTASVAKNIKLETEMDYQYEGESNKPVSLIEDKIAEKKRVENHFDENGRIVELLESHYEEREKKSKKKNKDAAPEKETVLLNDKKTSLTYDEEGRISEEKITRWSYRTNSFGRNLVEEHETKNVYDYSSVTEKNSQPANLSFYEDGELHLERKYSSATDYSEKLYFEGGFSVELLYKGGVKTSEIIYLDGQEQRRREFEY